MKFLLALLLLLPLPAFADAAKILELKKSVAEAEHDPATAEQQQKVIKAYAAEKELRQKEQDLTQQNTLMTEQFSKESKKPPATPQEAQDRTNAFKEKFDKLNAELSDARAKLPDAQQASMDARFAMRLAQWKARIGDAAYKVYSHNGSDVWENPETKQLDHLVVLSDGDGKKYFLQAPQNISNFTSPNCAFQLKTGEALAIRDGEAVEMNGSVIKVASLNQIYLLERPAVPQGCPLGTVVDKSGPAK
jgi:hypothetical protein